ncbi:MAG: hypothetical protein K9H64_22540 [Bacteroidales bacterium]|nr:hypothetical protein [Bacteroidales bacterium]
MKKIAILLLLMFAIASIQAQNYQDVLYLKNGSIIHGTILEQIPGKTIKIETTDNNIFVFQMDEVEKIAKERTVSTNQAEKRAEAKTFENDQPETTTIKQASNVIVKMNNGDEYEGQILKRDDKTIVLKTVNGEINLFVSNVRSIENNDYVGKFKFANPHDTRYFIGPSGIPSKKGEGYYQNIEVLINSINYGITDNLSIGGGFEFLSTIQGSPIWFLTSKLGFNISETFHFGCGVMVGGITGEGTAALGYGVFTFGSSESNLSLGAGYGLSGGELSDYPGVIISGTQRVSNSIALLSENYVFPNGNGDPEYFGIHGIRILSKKSSFDIGVIVIPAISDDMPALPFVGFVRVF